MAYYRDNPSLFGTGSRGFGTTWSYGGGERGYNGDLDPLDADARRGQHAGRGPKGYQRSDEAIREDVCMRLCDHPDIDPSEVEVRVDQAEVTLSGTVESRNMKRMAEDVVDHVSGVRDVHNQLRVA